MDPSHRFQFSLCPTTVSIDFALNFTAAAPQHKNFLSTVNVNGSVITGAEKSLNSQMCGFGSFLCLDSLITRLFVVNLTQKLCNH